MHGKFYFKTTLPLNNYWLTLVSTAVKQKHGHWSDQANTLIVLNTLFYTINNWPYEQHFTEWKCVVKQLQHTGTNFHLTHFKHCRGNVSLGVLDLQAWFPLLTH